MKNHIIASALLTISTTFFMASPSIAGVDADAAKDLAKSSGCLKCHAVDKTKVGPSYKNVAIKYKGKADAEESITKFITTGPKVKMGEGMELTHEIINTSDKGEIKNLVGWILSQ